MCPRRRWLFCLLTECSDDTKDSWCAHRRIQRHIFIPLFRWKRSSRYESNYWLNNFATSLLVPTGATSLVSNRATSLVINGSIPSCTQRSDFSHRTQRSDLFVHIGATSLLVPNGANPPPTVVPNGAKPPPTRLPRTQRSDLSYSIKRPLDPGTQQSDFSPLLETLGNNHWHTLRAPIHMSLV